jgi:hypothetical protein
MKKIFLILFLTCAATFIACEYDNYDEPETVFSGRVVYQGQSIGLGYGEVAFEMWEAPRSYTTGKGTAIAIPFNQEGAFSNIMFDGDYKLVIKKGQGPFVMHTNPETQSDTIQVNLKGSRNFDIEVEPYYMFNEDPTYTLNGENIEVKLKISKIITDARAKNIERVRVYHNATSWVSGSSSDYYLGYRTAGGHPADMDNVLINLPLTDLTTGAGVPKQNPGQSYRFLRAEIKISGVEDAIYSPVYRYDLP